MNYKGTIIEESLENKDVLKKVYILRTDVEPVKESHGTPWLKRWTLRAVEIPEEKAGEIAEEISRSLDSEHDCSWYADFKNNTHHYIIFRNKVFYVDRTKPEEYEEVKKYGMSLGVPEHQLDF